MYMFCFLCLEVILEKANEIWYCYYMRGVEKMQKEFLNEESYQQTNTKVKKIGKVLLIIGVCLLGLGFIFLLCGLHLFNLYLN